MDWEKEVLHISYCNFYHSTLGGTVFDLLGLCFSFDQHKMLQLNYNKYINNIKDTIKHWNNSPWPTTSFFWKTTSDAIFGCPVDYVYLTCPLSYSRGQPSGKSVEHFEI